MDKQDPPLEEVFKYLQQFPNFNAVIGQAIRQAIDEVIEGPRTGRWKVDALEKVEKTYIGTRVEIIVRSALGLEKGSTLDYVIVGHEVDAKFTLLKAWMIPQEAVSQLCLLLAADDENLKFSAGLVRTTPDISNHTTLGTAGVKPHHPKANHATTRRRAMGAGGMGERSPKLAPKERDPARRERPQAAESRMFARAVGVQVPFLAPRKASKTLRFQRIAAVRSPIRSPISGSLSISAHCLSQLGTR